MFAPSLMTFTGSVINRIETWSTPKRLTTLADRLFPSTLIGAVGLLGFGSLECVISGVQFIVWIAPVLVKQTLRLLRLRVIADRLPECDFSTLKILAHKTLALALQVIVGGLLMLFRPDKVVGLYDSLGLKRHRVSMIARELRHLSRRIAQISRWMLVQMAPAFKGLKLLIKIYPVPFIAASAFFTVLGARKAYRYLTQPPPPIYEEILTEWKEFAPTAVAWSSQYMSRVIIGSSLFTLFLTAHREKQKRNKT